MPDHPDVPEDHPDCGHPTQAGYVADVRYSSQDQTTTEQTEASASVEERQYESQATAEASLSNKLLAVPSAAVKASLSIVGRETTRETKRRSDTERDLDSDTRSVTVRVAQEHEPIESLGCQSSGCDNYFMGIKTELAKKHRKIMTNRSIEEQNQTRGEDVSRSKVGYEQQNDQSDIRQKKQTPSKEAETGKDDDFEMSM